MRYVFLIVVCLAIVCLAIVFVIPHNPIVDVIRNNPIVNLIRHNQRPSVPVTPRVNDSSKTAKPTPNGDEANNHDARLPINTAAAWREIDDPSRDGWETESLSNTANAQLKRLAKLISSAKKIQVAAVTKIASNDFSCQALRPPSLKTVFSDTLIRIQRPGDQPSDLAKTTGDDPRFRGFDGLVQALHEIRLPFQGPLRTKFKLFRIRKEGDVVTTHQFLSLAGQAANGKIEENAEWVAHWRRSTEFKTLQLIGIEVVQFERATIASKSPIFGDATRSVLGANPSYGEQLLYGFGYWLEHLQDKRAYSLFSTPALAVGDVNGDGLDDLYVCQEGGLPNLLYLQNPDGTARDVSENSGVNWLDSSRGALLLDFDNDGDQDLAVAITANVILAENDGAGQYSIRTVLPTTRSTFSLAAADYDHDADLDLFVCGYFPTQITESSSSQAVAGGMEDFVFHDANIAAPNSFFRNDWSTNQPWQFTDVTDEVGLGENNRRFSFAAAWEDFDNDGDQDLYVANDFGRNNLYRNDAGHFVDVAATADVEDSASGMGVTWADFDHDGWMDVYVSNMYSAAGNRVAAQTSFKPDSDDTVRKRILRFARGNSLFKNRGDGTFLDVSEPAGVTMGRWAWGSIFADLNNDGWEDLVVANGYITTADSGDL